MYVCICMCVCVCVCARALTFIMMGSRICKLLSAATGMEIEEEMTLLFQNKPFCVVYPRVEGHKPGKTRLRLSIPHSWERSHFVWLSMALLHVQTTKESPWYMRQPLWLSDSKNIPTPNPPAGAVTPQSPPGFGAEVGCCTQPSLSPWLRGWKSSCLRTVQGSLQASLPQLTHGYTVC